MKVFDKIKFIVDKILEVLGTATLGIMTVLVCYQVIARYVFNAPSAISEALSQYLFVWMIMFGSAYVYGSREHLAIDILKDRFSPKMYMIVEVITNILLFFSSACGAAGSTPQSRLSRSTRPCTFPRRSCTPPFPLPASSPCTTRSITAHVPSTTTIMAPVPTAMSSPVPHDRR